MYTVYILYSFKYSKPYTGYTSNLITRFYSHNISGTTDWTRNYRPWVVIYCEVFDTKNDAMKREKELKSGKGRDWIRNNLSEWLEAFG